MSCPILDIVLDDVCLRQTGYLSFAFPVSADLKGDAVNLKVRYSWRDDIMCHPHLVEEKCSMTERLQGLQQSEQGFYVGL